MVLSLLSSPGAGAQPDDVFRLGGDPGIIVGLLLTLARGMTPEQAIGVLFHFLIPCVLCWGGYRIFVPQRQQVSHGNVRLMPHRLFWQMLLHRSFSYFVADRRVSGATSAHDGYDRVSPFSLRSITFQALMVGA
jgi:hypothetical protein